MIEGIEEIEDALAKHVVAIGSADGETEGNGELFPLFLQDFLCRLDSHSGILYIEDSFNEKTIDTTIDKGINLFTIGLFQHSFIQWGLFASTHTSCLRCRSDATQDITRFIGCSKSIRLFTCQLTGSEIDVANLIFQTIVSQRDALRIKGVGFDNISTSFEIFVMDITDDNRTGHRKQIVATHEWL